MSALSFLLCACLTMCVHAHTLEETLTITIFPSLATIYIINAFFHGCDIAHVPHVKKSKCQGQAIPIIVCQIISCC